MATARLPRIDLGQLLQEPDPHIDLRENIFHESTRNFLKALENFKLNAISSISDRRKYQATEKKKITEKTQQVEAEINRCKLKEIELVADLEREKVERKDAELAVAAYQRQLASLKDRCSAIQGEIDQYRAITETLRREKNKERATLSTYASQVSSELIACERHLSCHIEGIGPDKLLFRFSDIDPEDDAREGTVVLDVAHSYKVLTVSPNLPAVAVLSSQLADSGDIDWFIKEVRRAFVENWVVTR